jgi:hypothetical protein
MISPVLSAKICTAKRKREDSEVNVPEAPMKSCKISPSTSRLRPSWCGTVALMSKHSGQPIPIVVMSAFPNMTSVPAVDDELCEILQSWPVQLVVSGVCSAKTVIAQYREAARMIHFQMLNDRSPIQRPSTHHACNAHNQTQSENQTPTMDNHAKGEGATILPAQSQRSYFTLFLNHLHSRGLAAVMELPEHTCLLVSHHNRPHGVLFPKLQLFNTPTNTYRQFHPTRRRLPNISTCVVCLDHAATYALVPCGHLCVCENDLRAFLASGNGRRCPICRTTVQNTLRVFCA